jgi:magnesium-transporting ATPase (P-type)
VLAAPPKNVVEKMAEEESDDATRPVTEILRQHNVTKEQGLGESESKIRLERDGPNELLKPKPPSLGMLFLMQLVNVIIMLLIVSAIASWIVNAQTNNFELSSIWKKWNSYVEGTAIMGIVIINAGIAAVTENDANNALEALSKMSQPQQLVQRDGEAKLIPSNQIVQGDIVILNVGDVCPADLRLITSDELKVNEML